MGNVDLPIALAILQLAATTAAAWLLYLMLREFRLLRRRLESGREKKEGQTINVNLTPVTVPEGKSPPPPPPREPEPLPAKATEPETPPPPPPPPIPRTLGSVSVTAAGLVAVKCPKCGSENSSYRSECFNCGSALR